MGHILRLFSLRGGRREGVLNALVKSPFMSADDHTQYSIFYKFKLEMRFLVTVYALNTHCSGVLKTKFLYFHGDKL